MSNLDNLPSVRLMATDGANHAPDVLTLGEGGEEPAAEPGPEPDAGQESELSSLAPDTPPGTDTLLEGLETNRTRRRIVLVSIHHIAVFAVGLQGTSLLESCISWPTGTEVLAVSLKETR